MEALYQQRLNRYVTAMRNDKPDMIPIRPFVAEFTGTYAGYTCQELAHDYQQAFRGRLQVCRRLRLGRRRGQHGLRLDRADPGRRIWPTTAFPGIDVPANMGFQYREPPEDHAFMRPDEYDQLIEDPTGLPLQRLAAARGPAGADSSASRSRRRTICRSSRAAWP